MNDIQTISILISHAQEKFGKQRAEELRSDLELLAADLAEVSAAPVDLEDEP